MYGTGLGSNSRHLDLQSDTYLQYDLATQPGINKKDILAFLSCKFVSLQINSAVSICNHDELLWIASVVKGIYHLSFSDPSFIIELSPLIHI